MMQQLFIDGQLADISENTSVSFSIVSNLLTGAASFVGNRTLTIKLPFTVRNMRLIEQAQIVQAGSGFPYLFHGVEYHRDGVPVIQGGLGRLTSVTKDEINIAVTWGVRTAVDALLTGDGTLADLTTQAAIQFRQYPNVTPYTDALRDDVFFAALDTIRHEGANDHYHTHVVIGSDKYDYTEAFSASSYLHPSVRMSWLLDLMEQQYGAHVTWDEDAWDDINTMIVPLVSKIPNGTTYNNGFTASAAEPSQFGGLGGNFIRFTTTHPSAIIAAQSNPPEQTLVCATAFSGLIRYQFVMYINEADLVSVSYPVMRARYGYSLGLRVGNDWHWCQILPEGMTFLAEKVVSGKLTIYATGYLAVDMAVGDVIAMRIAPISGGVRDPEIASDLHVQGGPIYVSDIVGKENEVQPGQVYPVEGNLPSIKPIDLIKFLAAVTGVFPVQASTSDELIMQPVEALFDWDNAVDWSNRVLSESDLPAAKENEYAVNGWAQQNWWRWKQDDTVVGDYDGSILVDDDTLEQSRDVMEFPFAATDGNNIPMYTTENGKTKYNKVEPRVLMIRRGDNDEAVGYFDMDMKRILAERYGDLAETMSQPVVITETIRINDVELGNVDESRAIFIAQHGAYFALLELNVKGDGTAEAKLLKLKKQEEM